MSKESAKSEWVKAELNWALDNMPGKVIPIKVNDCKLEDFNIRLPLIQFLDFSNNNFEDGKDKLVHLFWNIEINAISRIFALDGTWNGMVHQESFLKKDPIDYPITLKLKINAKREFKGSFNLILPERGKVDFTVTSGSIYEKYVHIIYHSSDSKTIQFGSIILELNSVGTKMVGKALAYGAQSESIVYGEMLLTKQNS